MFKELNKPYLGYYTFLEEYLDKMIIFYKKPSFTCLELLTAKYHIHNPELFNKDLRTKYIDLVKIIAKAIESRISFSNLKLGMYIIANAPNDIVYEILNHYRYYK